MPKGKDTIGLTTQIERINILKAMHAIMLEMNNEDARHNAWFFLFSENPSDDEYVEKSLNEDEFKEAVVCFLDIMLLYGKDGLYIGHLGDAILYQPHDWVVDPSKAAEEDL